MVLPELTAYLAAQGSLSLVQGTNLFYGILPDTPDILVALLEYPGKADEPNLGKGTVNLEYPRIQVVCRGIRDVYDAPRLMTQNIRTIFMAVVNQSIGGISYKAIESIGTPAFRRDDNFRTIVSLSYEVTKGYSTT